LFSLQEGQIMIEGWLEVRHPADYPAWRSSAASNIYGPESQETEKCCVECVTLYSENLHDGQRIDGQLTIRNPLRSVIGPAVFTTNRAAYSRTRVHQLTGFLGAHLRAFHI
jgi:hypothetical protein